MIKRYFLFGMYMMCGLWLLAQQLPQEPIQTYVMHSSGLHLKMDSNRGGRLEATNASNPQKMTLIPDGKGYYSIKAQGQELFLSLSGSWNTLFIADSSAAVAKYAIEPASGQYIKLRCRSNNLYLGTDGSEAEARVYSDKSGNDALHWWYLADDPTAEVRPDTVSYPVVPSIVRQKIEGWGTSLCWWANMCGHWDEKKIDQLVDWMVSPEGLNYNIFRYNIGGGDDPKNAHCTPHHMGSGKGLRAEMEGFKDSSGDTYHWDRDEAQRKILLKIHQKRPDAIFEAFSNSAPYYMTYSGCVAGHTSADRDNLKPEYYEEFAHYLVDVCRHYRDEYGIEFKTLEPFNEPVTNYWQANGGQEGCHFSTSAQIAFLKVLQPILQASGLSTVIASSDETDVSQSVKDFTAYQSASALAMLGQWNTHTYQYNNSGRTKLAQLAHEAGMPLWMSEVGAGSNLPLAQILFDDMRYLQAEAWIDWQYMEENGSTWGLLGGSFSNQTFIRQKKYYTRQQCSRFIRQGYEIVTSLSGQSMAALSPGRDTLVLALLNEGNRLVHQIDLRAFPQVGDDIAAYRTSATENLTPVRDYVLGEGKVLSVLLPSQSLTTLVLPVGRVDADSAMIRTDCDYLIVPRLETTRCVAPGSDGRLILDDINYQSAQRWRLTPVGNAYRLQNADGKNIAASPYATSNILRTVTTTAGLQTFRIDIIDWPYCKVVSAREPQYAMELVGEKTASGTSVSLWPYADGSAPTHRQWMLVPLPTDGGENGISSPRSEVGVVDVPFVDGLYTLSGTCLCRGDQSAWLRRCLPQGVYIEQKQGLSRKFVVQ